MYVLSLINVRNLINFLQQPIFVIFVVLLWVFFGCLNLLIVCFLDTFISLILIKKMYLYLTQHFGAKALNGSLGPGTQDPNEGTQMVGPKYWDPNFEVRNVRVPSAGTHHPGTQMKGPR